MTLLRVAVTAFSALFLGVTSLSSSGAPGPGVEAADEPTAKFTVAGDFSSSPSARAVLAGMAGGGSDLTLALGDLSYGTTGAEQAWCDVVTAGVGAGYPFELIAGNHEGNGQNGNINDFSACLPNQLPGVIGTYGRQYYVDVPAAAPLVRYLMISPNITFSDGTWSYDAGTPRYGWTEAAIDGARSAGIPWVVVGMHKPCLSVGEYACQPGADLMNLLIDKKVDLVLTGHEHYYARTDQLATGQECPALVPDNYAAACAVDVDATMVKGAGTVFGTVGTGGTPLRDINTSDPEFSYFAATSGANRDPAYGYLELTVTPDRLDGTFRAVSGATFTDAFAMVRGNLPPSASFTTTYDGTSVSFDAVASSDPDGSIASYLWDFGDGATASGVTASHTYAGTGDYQVRLTVTDDAGSTGSVTKAVTVVDPNGGPDPFATDDFARNSVNGWGTAPLGGNWSITGAVGNASVSAGSGSIRMPTPGSAPGAQLNGVSSTDTELRVTVGLDKASTGIGTSVRVLPRRLANGDSYFAAVRFVPNGTVVLTLMRLVGTQTKLATVTVAGLTHQLGDRFNVRTQATGTFPTTIRAKVWKVGTQEPTAWAATVTDATAALQTLGGIGLRGELATNATNAPVQALFDDLWAGPTS
ncbi:PKD domain-containing protein [Nocardioides sp. Root140]|uniref:PKD domain-containing protein n=1 Tax=Nocardioides sp. Root140 TaxID=1736460 RepID=UPI0009E90500|nr:PKD domain-containing protein [Nocardioides sp. Root140]